jgi:copper chaperone CopZ
LNVDVFIRLPKEEEVQVANKRTVKKRKLNHLDAQIKAQLQDTSDLLTPREFVPRSRQGVEIAGYMAMGGAYFLNRPYLHRVPRGAHHLFKTVLTKARIEKEKAEERKRKSIGMCR